MSSSDFSKLKGIKADDIVYKDGNKVLSTNDFTDELKELLESIEESADVNIIEGVKVDGILLTPDENK
jgi:hypothetical protein